MKIQLTKILRLIKNHLILFSLVLMTLIVVGDTNPNITHASSSPLGAVQLSLLSNHEDSSVQITIDLTKLKASDYFSLAVRCTKENGKTDFPLLKMSPSCGNGLKSLQSRTYTTVVSNLNPNSTYEFCLSGINKNYQSTGDFECAMITTTVAKPPVALIFINYDVSNTTRTLIKRYEDTLKFTNPNLVIVDYTPTQKISSSEMLAKLRTQYASTNLKYVTLIGFDLPVPQTAQSVYFADPYRHLSVGEAIMNQDFIYTLNSEITLAVIRAESEQDMQNYFNRLYQFYTGALKFDKKLLIADAMIPSESSVGLSDAPTRYTSTPVDYVTGITNYFDPVVAHTSEWQNAYRQFLGQSHEITIINAHGSPEFHYPCRIDAPSNEAGCISSTFIKNSKPNTEFMIGISCNIGNFMTIGSPMIAYIFSGNALAGLGAEVPFWDSNGQIAKTVLKNLAVGMLIGDIARMNGFVVIGDPFLRLDMPQNYQPPSSVALSITPRKITINSGQSAKFDFSIPNNTPKTSMYIACPLGLVIRRTDVNAGNVSICNKMTSFDSPNVNTVTLEATNNSRELLKATLVFYAYFANNPVYGQGVSSDITVNPQIQTPPTSPTSTPPSFYYFRITQPLTDTIRSTTLTWIVDNASYCTLNGPGFVNVRKGANEAISTGNINSSATYILMCTNDSGLSTTKNLTVTVPNSLPISSPTPNPSSTPTPSPSVVSPYISEFRISQPITISTRSTTLVWNASNASRCVISGPNFANLSLGTSGAVSTGVLNSDSAYTLTCANNTGQSATKTLFIAVPSQTSSINSTKQGVTFSDPNSWVANVLNGIANMFNN